VQLNRSMHYQCRRRYPGKKIMAGYTAIRSIVACLGNIRLLCANKNLLLTYLLPGLVPTPYARPTSIEHYLTVMYFSWFCKSNKIGHIWSIGLLPVWLWACSYWRSTRALLSCSLWVDICNCYFVLLGEINDDDDYCAVAPVLVRTSPRIVAIPAGSAAQLLCQGQGRPRPEVTWLKDGVELAPGLYNTYTVTKFD